MKRIATALVSLFIFLSYATAQNPVSWTFSLEDNGNGEISLIAKATIEPGWHLYDTEIPEGGPTPTTLTIDKLKGAEPIGKFHAEGTKPHVAFDPVFGMQIGTFDGSVRFVQRFKITDRAEFVLEGDVRAQACNEQTCTPPLPVDFAFTSGDLPETVASSADNKTPVAIPQPPLTEDTIPATDSAGVATLVAPITTGHAEIDKNPLWTPVIEELKAYGMEGNVSEMSLWWIFISGFIGGIIALLTPCVWPMIPMTVSFFLKRNAASRKKAVSQAIVYGVAIIAIYLALGLLITAIFGASALNNLATSAVFNLIFFALLVLFAISFFGGFDLVLPASWTNKMDSKAESASGTLSIFFMAFTLVLVSFSCTGPIIGTLLVEAATWGNILSPTIGMFGFALGTGHSLRSVCHFPLVAANHAEIGRLAERRKNSPRFLGTGFCVEVFIGCRSGLRMGHSRQGSIPCALDRNLCTAWHVPTR
jgi:cytochrome c biogenesis protein CcdA